MVRQISRWLVCIPFVSEPFDVLLGIFAIRQASGDAFLNLTPWPCCRSAFPPLHRWRGGGRRSLERRKGVRFSDRTKRAFRYSYRLLNSRFV